MSKSAIEKWLTKEFSKRFQNKASEYLTTLIWFDPNRYWLPSMPWLLEKSNNWTILLEDGSSVPMNIVAVGQDIPDGKGQSPLKIRISILENRATNSDEHGLITWKHLSRWIIYYPYPTEWLNEATRPQKTPLLSWLTPFCEAGLEWGKRGGDEEKLPAFLRSHGVDITKDKKQISELYHLSKPDRSASPLARLVANNLDKPVEFWGSKSWDLDTVQSELIGDLGRQLEELLVNPEITLMRLKDTEVLGDFISQLNTVLGGSWDSEVALANPVEFSRNLVKHASLATTYKLTRYDSAFPFKQQQPPHYKIDRCQETIADWLKIPEVGKAYVEQCRILEKGGLNLIGNVDVKTFGHVFPHLVLYQWIEVKKILEEAAASSVDNIRSVIKRIRVEKYDKIWDQLIPGELGWRWLDAIKDIQQRITAGESWFFGSTADQLEAYLAQYSDTENGWWKIDDIFRKLLILSVDDPRGDLIKALAMPLYNFWIKTLGENFTKTFVNTSDLHSQKTISHVTKASKILWPMLEENTKRAIIFVDAMRYDLAMEIKEYLQKAGFKVQVKPWMADLPTKTEVGMGRLLPDCDLKLGIEDNKIAITHNGKQFKFKNKRIEYLSKTFGEILGTIDLKDVTKTKLKGQKAKILAVFSLDIDTEGEAKGLGLVKDIEKEVTELVQKIRVLAKSGYTDVHVVTDHGFLMSSKEGLTKWAAPQGADVCERRYAFIPKNIGTDLPAITTSWNDTHLLVLPPAGTVFKSAGQLEYLHGGASLQEMVIPYISAEVQKQVVRVLLTMRIENEVIDSGVVKVILEGKSPIDQLTLPGMPTVVISRPGNLIAQKKGEPISQAKNFELGVGDSLKLTIFLDKRLKQGDEVDIIAKDSEEVLATKTLKVIQDV